MKKFVSIAVSAAIISAIVPAYAYNQASYHSKASELYDLIDECKEMGINTQYEEIDANIIDKYADRIAYFQDNGIDSTITTYQLTELDSMYANAKANLIAYKNATKMSPSKAYRYKTSDGYTSVGASLRAGNGAPYFSAGFGHFSLSSYVEEFSDYGYDNIQALIGLGDVIANDRDIDNWDTSINGGADVSFSMLDNNGYSDNTSLHVTNNTVRSSNVYGRLFQRIAVKPNTNYIISFRVKGSIQTESPRTYFTYSVEGTPLNRVNISGFNTSSWTQITDQFTTGDDEFIKGLTFLFEGICDVYIDDIVIRENGSDKNMVRNGGFDGDGHDDFDIIYETNNQLVGLLKDLYEGEKNNVHVEVLLELQQGMPKIITDAYPEIESGGRYNVDHPVAVEIERAYIEDILGLISDYSSLGSIILVNEPYYNTSAFSVHYANDYATYLKNKHGSIETLSSVYGKSYTAFNRVGMPEAFESTPRFYDWMNFNDSVFTAWYDRTAAIVESCIPDAVVSVKAQPDFVVNDYNYGSDSRFSRMSDGVNMELLDSSSGYHGNDASSYYEEDGTLRNTMKWYDYLNSISDKPIYNSENHIIKESSALYNSNINKFVKNALWQSAVHGLDMHSIWTWSMTTDTTSTQYGHLAMRPSVLADAAKTNLDINRVATKITSIANAAPDVAILRDDASRIYNTRYMHTVSVAYNAAMESGHKVGFVTPNNIDSKLSRYETLIIPYTTNVETNVVNAINGFSGRIIVLGSGSLAKDEYNRSYSSGMLTKINSIKGRASVINITNDTQYKISAPTTASLAAVLKDTSGVVVTNSDGTATSKVEWQSVPYQNGYLVSINNYDQSGTRNLVVKLNDTRAAYMTDLVSGTKTAGSAALEAMTGSIYYVRNVDDEIADDIWEDTEDEEYPQVNDITKLNAQRNGNINTLSWESLCEGINNIYSVEPDGRLTFIASTNNDSYDDISESVKTYVVKCVTQTGESYGKAITCGYDVASAVTVVTECNEGTASMSVSYTNDRSYSVAITVTATAYNQDGSFADAVIIEQIIPAGKTINYNKAFSTEGTGTIIIAKK